jgi:hypothetical protein
MKYTRKKVSHPGTGAPLVFFEVDDATFCVRVSGEGVRLEGQSPTLATRGDLDSFAKLIATAWKEHLQLKPALVTTIAGH